VPCLLSLCPTRLELVLQDVVYPARVALFTLRDVRTLHLDLQVIELADQLAGSQLVVVALRVLVPAS